MQPIKSADTALVVAIDSGFVNVNFLIIKKPAKINSPVSGFYAMIYPRATMLKTSAKRATVSQRPTTVMYCEKPLPVSARASAPAAPALP